MQEASMNSIGRKLAIGLAVASAIVSIAAGTAIAQQNVDAIREQCITQAMAQSPSLGAEKGNPHALNLYRTCMRNHGLTP
jgi:hypothetical protein